MPDIFHQLSIESSLAKVFGLVSTAEGLDQWWTQTCRGDRMIGGKYELGFGPDYAWGGVVRQLETDRCFELEITVASDDWMGTRVGFQLQGTKDLTELRFHHLDWHEESDHFRTSSYCWAMYLRLLKQYLERGEFVPYGDRPSA